MTSDAIAEGGGPAPRAAVDPRPPAAEGAAAVGAPAADNSELLDLCDRIIGEMGRRRHLFSWLRAPGAAEGWLAVDAYYPASRLVVVCHLQPGPHDHLYRELIPGRGLRLLELSTAELPVEGEAAATELRRLIADLGPAPPRAVKARSTEDPERETPLAEVAMARIVSALTPPPTAPAAERRGVGPSRAAAAERGARFVAEHRAAAASRAAASRGAGPRAEIHHPRSPRPVRPHRTRTPPTARFRPAELQPRSLVIGLALAAVVLAEAYFGVARIGLDQGHVLLAFGLALDACARTLGTAAARRAGRVEWSWLSALGGSPLVAWFVFFQRSGPVRVDPAPLAGLISLLAVLVVLLSLILALPGF
jgi:hypothetical protein